LLAPVPSQHSAFSTRLQQGGLYRRDTLLYAKAQREDMTADQKKQVRALATALREAYRRKR
jgi:hypothetical protein